MEADGKPVIVGEQGNAGMNWDPRSAVRMRIRAWTALFREIGLVFWNTSESKAAMFGGHYSPGKGAKISVPRSVATSESCKTSHPALMPKFVWHQWCFLRRPLSFAATG